METMGKEVVMDHVKVLTQHLSGDTVENHEISK
jgi:hypothetical protein